jgi:hypothetical protein
MEANASRHHGKAPDEIECSLPEHQTRAVKEYLAALEAQIEPDPDRKPPKVISPSDRCPAWTAAGSVRLHRGLIDGQPGGVVASSGGGPSAARQGHATITGQPA